MTMLTTNIDINPGDLKKKNILVLLLFDDVDE